MLLSRILFVTDINTGENLSEKIIDLVGNNSNTFNPQSAKHDYSHWYWEWNGSFKHHDLQEFCLELNKSE